MYGTLDNKLEDDEERQRQQVLQSSNDSSSNGAELRHNKKIHSHCHIQSVDHNEHEADRESRRSADESARRRLIIASGTCLVFMVAEIVGGVLSNSLAIATDAAHLLTDFASFMISLFAIWLSSRPATRKMSFGWYRAEVIGALISVLMIWLVTGLLVYMAIERLITGKIAIDSTVMVITASGGLLVNIIMAVALNMDGRHGHSHGHSHGHRSQSNHSHLEHVIGTETGESEHLAPPDHSVVIDCSMREGLTADSSNGAKQQSAMRTGSIVESGVQACDRGSSNINVRAAFIHVIGDFLQSLGVLIAALVIHFEPSYSIIDPICTFLFSFIVLVTTLNIIRDATNVLMEGIPDGINFIEVHEQLQSLPNVIRVHNLRIWSLSLDKIAISTHLVIDSNKTTSASALKNAIDFLKSSYNFFEMTIQIEEYRDDMKDCEHCRDDRVLPEPISNNASTSINL